MAGDRDRGGAQFAAPDPHLTRDAAAGGDGGTAFDRHGKHRPAGVVHVLADEIDPAGGDREACRQAAEVLAVQSRGGDGGTR